MNKIPLIIDTDPGIDDTLAIIMAAASQKHRIVALTATHGNVGLAGTSRNALNLAEFLGLDCIVATGADRPLIVKQKDASQIHGANGLAGFMLPQAKGTFSDKSAWDVMYEQAVKENGELVLAVLGPLTNVAIALLKYPDFPKYIKKIFMMGGSRSFGNHSQYAEFNIWGDPHACQIVLNSGIEIVMADLIFGKDHYIEGKQLRQAYDNAKKLKPLMEAFWQHDMQWVEKEAKAAGTQPNWQTRQFAIYDATAIGAMLLEEKLETESYYVICETQGSQTQGQTIFDFKGFKNKEPNVKLAVKMPIEEYRTLLADAIAYFE